MSAIEMAAKETNDKARRISGGIAEWIDAQRAAGTSEANILDVLNAVSKMVDASKKLKAPA